MTDFCADSEQGALAAFDHASSMRGRYAVPDHAPGAWLVTSICHRTARVFVNPSPFAGDFELLDGGRHD